MALFKIDLEREFAKHQDKILELARSYIDGYKGSTCRKTLERRIIKLRDMTDGIFPQNQGFQSNISFSMYAERFRMRRAFLSKNFGGDPLVNIIPIGNTSAQSAKNMQHALNQNYQMTQYRRKAFNTGIDNVSKYGCAVIFSTMERGTKSRGYATQYNGPESGALYSRKPVDSQETINIVNYAINPLNYGQDPECVDPDYSSNQHFIDKWSPASFRAKVEASPKNYIKENVEKVWKLIREKGNKYQSYAEFSTMSGEEPNSKVAPVYVERLWGKFPIEGNESDDSKYYIEIVDDIIIRFQRNYLDYDITPLTVKLFQGRDDVWWGNTDGEGILSHQDYINFLMNIKAEEAMQSLDKILFVDKDLMGGMANRRKMGGKVPFSVDISKPINSRIYEWQHADRSNQDVSWVIREIKESAQATRPSPDLRRAANEGGLQNKTLGAAQMIQGVGDILENDLNIVYSYGEEIQAEKNLRMLQQYLGDTLQIRPSPKEAAKILQKWEILGDFGVVARTTYTDNAYTKFTQRHNFLMSLMNLKASPDPNIQRINLDPYIQEFLDTSDTVDVEEGYPEAQPQPQGGVMVPGMPQLSAPAQTEQINPTGEQNAAMAM